MKSDSMKVAEKNIIQIGEYINCVNYFDIQVLMMVTETETLTSTLHHDIFNYLDYVFFCYLHTHRDRERERERVIISWKKKILITDWLNII